MTGLVSSLTDVLGQACVCVRVAFMIRSKVGYLPRRRMYDVNMHQCLSVHT